MKVYDSIIRLEAIDENVFAAIPDVLFKIVLPACACSIFKSYNNFFIFQWVGLLRTLC